MTTIEITKQISLFGNDFQKVPSFLEDKKNIIDLQKAHRIISHLLFWQKGVYRSALKGKQLSLRIFNYQQYFMIDYDKIEYENILNNCLELSKIFIIKDDFIELNPLLSNDEIINIRQIIEDDFEVILHA
ncbi:hypothetical protein [Chryseobacterium sp. SL1]|uniref:hypothetical protein n=1 Tax=Chryseobacterium sp. SL1 TaxID=2995159 RepID=UPI002276E894|nr:hypothetical protein [Chryseobacterium sp. SL1]MCY1659618.1 hypothetical protein [Chryseobacterium sp. SL1]